MTRDAVKKTVFALALILSVTLSVTAVRAAQISAKSNSQVKTVPLPERGNNDDRPKTPPPKPPPPPPKPPKPKEKNREGGNESTR